MTTAETRSDPATQPVGPDERADQAALFNRCFGRDDGDRVLPWRYDAGPHGSSITLGVRGPGGKLAASYACSPRLVRIGGEEVVVGETGDVMTDPELRGKGLFSALDRAAMTAAREAGWPVVFGLPNRQSAHIFTRELGWEEVGRVRPWTFVLAVEQGARDERMRAGRLASAGVPWTYWRGTMRRGKMRDLFFEKCNVVPLARFKPEVDAVSAAVADQKAWMVRRDHEYLNWRFVDAPSGRFRAHGVFEPSGAMRGYTVVQVPDRGEPVGFIVDLVAVDRVAFAAAMEAALGHLRKAGASVARAYAVEGAEWERDLRWSGFRAPKKEDHKAVIVHVLDPASPAAAVARQPARWAFTDADRDAELIS